VIIHTVNRQTSVMNDYDGGGGDDSTVTVTVKTKCVFVVVNCRFISYVCKANVSP
jgi:hypothetical protein